MEIVRRNNPRGQYKSRTNEENNYQYFKERKDGWTFSVVCNYGTRGQQEGLFEVGIWNNLQEDHAVIVVNTHCTFQLVASYEKQFDTDPKKLAMKSDAYWSGEGLPRKYQSIH
jgi:hypothetical protein